MALLNPVYALIVPFLFVVTIPLAILAGITTTLAFSVLMFRVAVVYVDIAVNMVPQYVTGRRIYPFPRGYATSLITSAVAASNIPPPSPVYSRSGSGHNTPSPTLATNRTPGRHHRRRRTSGASFASVGSITPIEDNGNTFNNGSKRDSFMMIPSIGMDRDFEGVGGWRLKGKNADDDDAWAQLNSRLELPLDHQRRHHHRSPSGGGATTPGSTGDFLMMKSPRATRSKEGSPDNTSGSKRGRERKAKASVASPNSSRQRTPTNGMTPMPPPLTMIDQADGSYFPPILSPKTARRPV